MLATQWYGTLHCQLLSCLFDGPVFDVPGVSIPSCPLTTTTSVLLCTHMVSLYHMVDNDSLLRYVSLKLLLRFRMLFQYACAAQLHCKPEGFFGKLEGFFREQEVSSKDAEGLFWLNWLSMYLRFRKTVQFHLRIFQSFV